MKREAKAAPRIELRIGCETARQIRQHARGSSKIEVCGVLIGSEEGGVTVVRACISGVGAEQGGSHVTFTQDTWEHIYRIKDRDYPDERIVGWYHSHPGFGVFLSDHDTFIHKNFFSAPNQVAWVYDPHSDEEGCFGWRGDSIERLERIVFLDEKGGEGAGETGKPEPLLNGNDSPAPEGDSAKSQGGSLLDYAFTIFSYLALFLAGFMLAYFLFPRLVPVPVPVDPSTGMPLMVAPSQNAAPQSQQPAAAQPPTAPSAASPQAPAQGEKGKP